MVARLRIAARSAVHRSLRQSSFNPQDGLRRLGCLFLRLPGQREQLRRVVRKLTANLRHVGVIFNVVIAVGQRKAALVNVGDHHIGIVQVRLAVKIEQRIRPDHVRVRDHVDECLFILHGSHAVQFGLKRLEPFRINRLLIHAGGVIVSNLLVNRVALRIIYRRLF